MKDTTLIKTRTKAGARESSQTGMDVITRASFIAVGGISVVVGLWALASLVGVMITSGGPLALIKAWFGAVFGL